jgi:hypothetical protein
MYNPKTKTLTINYQELKYIPEDTKYVKIDCSHLSVCNNYLNFIRLYNSQKNYLN